jgi:hypothetical protein
MLNTTLLQFLIEKYTIKKIILEIVSKIGRKPDVSEN